jgi:hypothetical protein
MGDWLGMVYRIVQRRCALARGEVWMCDRQTREYEQGLGVLNLKVMQA